VFLDIHNQTDETNINTTISTISTPSSNFSYEFLKAHMQFIKDDDDVYSNPNTSILFSTIKTKITNLEKFGIDPNGKHMIKINTTIEMYFKILYTEVTNALINFSDGYLRYLCNQIRGFKFIEHLLKIEKSSSTEPH
jgi:hypothetical protein